MSIEIQPKPSRNGPPDGEVAGAAQGRRKLHFGGLSGTAIRRPVFTAMMMLGLIVVGLFSFRGLAIDQFPDVEIPVVAVQTVYPGGSPEVIEREVTERLEEAFNPVDGVDNITSMSLEGVSLVIVEFDLDRNVDEATQDIRSKIDAVRRDLPADIEQPIVQQFDPGALPIVSLALASSTRPIEELTTLADEGIRRRLESISGVGQVTLAGGLLQEIRVNLMPSQMQALGVSVQEIMGALQAQNLEAPAGRIERGNEEQLVRVMGRIENAADFNDIIVANRNGSPVRLSEVARVEVGTEEERSLAFVNQNRAVGMDIVKVSGANTVAVAEEVIEAVGELNLTLPEDVEIQVIRDNSVMIRHSVEDVIFELILGAILTVIIVMVFLNDWKATAITSFALPVSVISAFILMNALDFTLNNITLLGLSLSIGILIDDAIVVIENIMRHREMGRDHFFSAGVGTKEIFLAVLATTLSIVAVFVPVAFMGGIIGRFFFQFGLTVAWAVLVSLFVSFTLTPMLSAWWGVDPHTHDDDKKGNPLKRGIGAFNRWFDRVALRYRGIIEWSLGHRKSVVVIATASFVGAILLFPLIGGGFMPPNDQGQFTVSFEVPEGSSIGYTRAKALDLAANLEQIPGVEYTYTTIGAGALGTVTSGSVYVKLVSSTERDYTQDEGMVLARNAVAGLYGVNVQVLQAGLGGSQAPLAVEVRGRDIMELTRLAAMVEERVRSIDGVVDVQNSLGAPRPEFRIEVNRDVANELGLTVGQVASVVRPVLAGVDVTTWEDPSGEERDVVLQVAAEERVAATQISGLPIATARRTATGAAVTVPLEAVATVRQGEAPAQIDRDAMERVATISAGTLPEVSVSEASQAITAAVADLDLPAGYSVSLGGETEQLAETAGYVLTSILLAIILIYLILASQFESLLQPLAIMLSLPLSLIGVLLALLLTGDTFNMMSMIGVILLMGLVTKNAILLVDNANERRAEGKDRWTALVEAGQVRLRPIMMTTLAMIAGMLPIALAMGEGGGFRAPMARAVIGGLITSTLLTLIVVPVVYTYFDDFGEWVKSKFVTKERVREIEREQAESGLALEPVWGDA